DLGCRCVTDACYQHDVRSLGSLDDPPLLGGGIGASVSEAHYLCTTTGGPLDTADILPTIVDTITRSRRENLCFRRNPHCSCGAVPVACDDPGHTRAMSIRVCLTVPTRHEIIHPRQDISNEVWMLRIYPTIDEGDGDAFALAAELLRFGDPEEPEVP